MQIKLEKKFYDNLASNWSCWLDPNELFLIPYEKGSTRFISLVKTKERHYDLGLSFSDIYKKVQAEFNALAGRHHAEIMQMRRDRNRAGLQELQDKLVAEAEKKVGKSGMTDEQMAIYSTVGGTPHLDGQYTVFGEVEEGLEVVEMIQSSATGRGDRPVDDIEMKMLVIE